MDIALCRLRRTHGREGTNARCLRSGKIQTDTAKFPQIGRFHILGVEGYE
jgi:hypothetical protein